MELKKVADDILKRIKNESVLNKTDYSIGRIELQIDGLNKIFWIRRNQKLSKIKYEKDILGNVIAFEVESSSREYLSDNTIYRHAPILTHIYKYKTGISSYIRPDRKVSELLVCSFSKYIPDIERIDAFNGEIEIINETPFGFRSLKDAINEFERLIQDKTNIQTKISYEKIDSEIERLKNELESKEKEILIAREGLERHINVYTRLKDNPLLDEDQRTIMYEKLLQGVIIINGGPGTGKSSVLIQRISFLTSSGLEELVSTVLTDEDKELFYNPKKGWIFFSPSKLLSEYLRDIMSDEGLSANRNTVYVWDYYRASMMNQYGFYSNQGEPFIPYYSEKVFFSTNKQKIFELIEELDNHIIIRHKAYLQKILDIEKIVFKFKWKVIGFKIISSIKYRYKNLNTLESLIHFYEDLNNNYFDDLLNINKEYNETITDVVLPLQASIIKDYDLINWLLTEMDSDLQADKNPLFEEEIALSFEFNSKLNSYLKRLIKNYALSKVDKTVTLTNFQIKLLEKVKIFIENIDKAKIELITHNAFFKISFEKLLSGFEINLLDNIPSIYKSFRKDILLNSNYLTFDGNNILIELINQNKKIHSEESELLLILIMRIIRFFYFLNKPAFDKSQSTYIYVFKNNIKGNVAVDEATDFTILQLACMALLSHPKYNSVTFSGDLMQSMTKNGIITWDCINEVFEKILNIKISGVFDLHKSYRQTPVLLEIAKKLYKKNTHCDAKFESYRDSEEYDIKPLLYKGFNEEEKITWIADKILYIRELYKSIIPTIGIFMTEDAAIEGFTRKLSNNSKLLDAGIIVSNCAGGKILGEASEVRVFNINHIKGMEFEAVFFIDIDKMEDDDSVFIDKYVYVGLSRARFFLAITIKTQFPKRLKTIECMFDVEHSKEYSKKIKIGGSDFKELILNNEFYIDKSLLIKEIIDCNNDTILYTRPRRFGKTLNLSMLKYFFSCHYGDNKNLFARLKISDFGEKYNSEQGKYPIIHITFKDIKELNWDLCLKHLKKIISLLFEDHDYLLEADKFKEYNKENFINILRRRADEIEYKESLKDLISYVFQYYNQKVVLLIDEYDTPIHEGYNNNYYSEIISFLRGFLGAAIKDNSTKLHKVIITGIFRVAKESIFSGLNNLKVDTITDENSKFSDMFGFTQLEIDHLLSEQNLNVRKEDICKWYGGYCIGGKTIYNPWSILSFASNPTEFIIPYWVNTSSNDDIKAIINANNSEKNREDIQVLLSGGTLSKILNEFITFPNIKTDSNVLWGFLLNSGYLKYNKKEKKEYYNQYFLSIPNDEIKIVYKEYIISWLETNNLTDHTRLRKMLQFIVDENYEQFQYLFKELTLSVLSFYDIAGNESERVWHVFVLAILINLEDEYIVKSNKESGNGRYDIILIPRNKNRNGIIIEFKKVDKKDSKRDINNALCRGIEQIKKNKYYQELKDDNINKFIAMAIVFQGKEPFLLYERLEINK